MVAPKQKGLQNKRERVMKVKTNVKVGGYDLNHSQTVAREQRASKGLKVKTSVKAGGYDINHSQAAVRDAA